MITASIDLSQLPFPNVVEVIDFESIYAERKANFVALFAADQQAEILTTLGLESEPLTMLLQESVYREITLRQRINDAARASMLAYAQGADLDHLAALLGIERLVITPADLLRDIAAVMESDADLRKRVQLAPESFSVAGPVGAYISTAMNSDGQVLDAAATSPIPGAVLVTVLSRDGDGTASADLLSTVAAAVGAEDVRPLTDLVTVQSAEIVEYEVEATIYTFPGPDGAVVLTEARKQLDAYIDACHRIGREVAISGLYAALHVDGVQRVILAKPAATVVTNETQAPHCTSVVITYGGMDE
jgi:phage-related baseplate assembly protein